MFIVLTNNKATMSHGCKPRISNSIKVWQLGIGNRELSAMLCSRDHHPPPPSQCAISYSQGYYERQNVFL